MTLDAIITNRQAEPGRLIRIDVLTACSPSDLYVEDIEAPGVYFVPVPNHFDDRLAATCAIGAFHSHIPVKFIDCFDFQISDAETGKRLYENYDVDCCDFAKHAGSIICAARYFVIANH